MSNNCCTLLRPSHARGFDPITTAWKTAAMRACQHASAPKMNSCDARADPMKVANRPGTNATAEEATVSSVTGAAAACEQHGKAAGALAQGSNARSASSTHQRTPLPMGRPGRGVCAAAGHRGANSLRVLGSGSAPSDGFSESGARRGCVSALSRHGGGRCSPPPPSASRMPAPKVLRTHAAATEERRVQTAMN